MKEIEIGDLKTHGDDSQPTSRHGGGGDVIPFFLAALFGAMTAIWGYWFFFSDDKEPDENRFPEFVVVESDTLLQAKIQETIMSGAENSEEIAETFKATMQEAFKVYTNRGVSVMHMNALMAFPEEYDVTMRMAQQLGIAEETIASVREFQRTGQLPQQVIDLVDAGKDRVTKEPQGRPDPPSFSPLLQ